MPRTKRPRKIRTSTEDNNEVEIKVEDFRKKCNMQIKNIEQEYDRMIMQMESNIDTALNRLPKEIRNMTFGELLSISLGDKIDSIECNDENESEISSQVSMKQNVRKHVSRFDSKSIKSKKPSRSSSTCGEIKSRPVMTDKSNAMASGSKRPHRSNSNSGDKKNQPMNVERSSSITGRKGRQSKNLGLTSAKKIVDQTPAKNRLIHPTPAKNNTPPKNYVVTPKVNLCTPLNILRRAREGEMALSMDGSPLYVSALAQKHMVNINVPLQNGNILSFLPRDGLRRSRLPDLDSDSLRQLRTLKNHIEKVIGRN